jgi:SAM-dependent methyltransferase
MKLYTDPLYYDIAFSWDLESEIGFLKGVFAEHVPFPVERLLEPACGTGRFLRALPAHGIAATGYDLLPEMVAFASGRIAEAGFEAEARAVLGDMRTARFEPCFDAALNSVNSFCYLLEDEDVESHLLATAASLKPGAVYVVHFSMAYEGELPSDLSTWTMGRDGVVVTTSWSIETEDAESGRSVHVSKQEITEGGETRTVIDRHELRVWTDETFRAMVERTGAFRLAGVRGDGFDYDRVPLDRRITGEMGNHYFILQRQA